MRFVNFLIVLLAKISGGILRIFGKNGGNVPGRIALALNPKILQYFRVDCPVIAVTATNGKTMTSNCIAHTLREAGHAVVSNAEGNNMETGILSTILKQCSLSGRIKADFLVFEVDESYVPVVFSNFRLDVLVVLNFFRDQLDRNGEVESLILKINEFLKGYAGNLILNGDDPNVARLGRANPANKNVKYFSVSKYEFATKEIREAGEGKFCPFCKTKLKYKYYQYSHVGRFLCPKCDFGNFPIYKLAEKVDLKRREFTVSGEKFQVRENSIYLIYNYLATIAACELLEIPVSLIQEALGSFELKNGRLENVSVDGVETVINLAKNPTGSNVSLRLMNEDIAEKELMFALNDNVADGFDVSWIWDVNFDAMKNVSRIITTGTRAFDIAIRIKTSGFPAEKIEVYPEIRDAVHALYQTWVKKYVIANYTALQPTRKEILRVKKHERN